ncbi:hypothetical protein MMC20_002696 [Loxospora ochrophaea]|nr:hypothetical protein [Loxospora ochrophaea]
MSSPLSQLFPPAAKFTEKELSDQAGKVFLVTGGASGLGLELVQILYSHNAKIYIAARVEDKAQQSITQIKAQFPKSKGELLFLHLDLGDLPAVKRSAEEFLSKEDRLNVLWNNAGVMKPPQGSKTTQGYELQLGTNCLGPYLFTKLLTPLLTQTAQTAPQGSVRVVWLASSAAEAFSPSTGVDMANIDYKKDKSAWHKYGVSKAGNVLYARELARRDQAAGILHVAVNPGNLKTNLQRHVVGLQAILLSSISYTSVHGAYTELFAGLSPDITPQNSGAWVIPWGRIGSLRKDLDKATKTKDEGGTGVAGEFCSWSEEQVKSYL